MAAGTLKLLHELKLLVTVGQSEREYPFYNMDFEFDYDRQCNGLISLDGSEVNQLLGGITMIACYADEEFTVKVGGTGETAIQTKWFSYSGPEVDLYFSNLLTTAMTITYFAFTETE